MGKEIEKKFLIHFNPFQKTVGKTIYQTYLASGEEEIRVRKIKKNQQETHTMTFKKGSGLIRKEIEFEIDIPTYEQLLSNTNRKPLIKTRTAIQFDGFEFDFDVYQNDELLGLQTIEVEFSSEEEARLFVKPDWFGEEITEDKSYKNQTLWEKIQ